jgi:aspartyl-tRNA(Asn)/glutamyl-tRNA(Gln) amidotransferase subunit C
MAISRKEVEQVAVLARLRLSDDELDRMTVQLGRILDYMQQLAELDTADVEPMAHALDLVNVLAEDEPRPSFPRDQMLQNAPSRDSECYRVPAALGE